jgi:hypothetical protein
MNIDPFIQTVFGAIVGGGVLLITNRLVARADKRKAVQEWYENVYVTEGIERLIIFFKSLELYFLDLKHPVGEIPRLIRELEDIPIEALVRVEALLQKDHFSWIILLAYPALGSEIEAQRKAAGKAINEALYVLYGLRNAFLQAIPKMSHKHLHEFDLYRRHQGKIGGDLSIYLNRIYTTLRDEIVEAAESNTQST